VRRRDWLKLVGVGLAGCSAPPDRLQWPDADPDGRVEPGPIEPVHSAATFDPGETDALLSVWAPGARMALPIIEELDTGRQASGDIIDLDGGLGGVGAGVLAGLSPGRDYRWFLRFDIGTSTPWFGLRTAPPAAEPAPLTLLYSADIDLNPAFDSPIFDTMAASGADFFVSLGDFPYADNAPGAWTVDEFRVVHRDVRAGAKVQRLLRAMGSYAIYDDHEARNNWDGGFAVSEADRIAAAVQVWDEWFPLRDRSTPRRRYRSWRWGALAEMFLLDTRLYRSDDQAIDDAAKTMLGAEQKQWLIDGLQASQATYKLVFTTVPLDFGNDGGDDWSGFTTERDQIFAAITDGGVTGVVFLSADQHWFAAHHHASGFIEWQVGPLARSFRVPSPLQPGVVARITNVYNYGEIRIDGEPPVLTFTARDPDGNALYTEALPVPGT
jgi:alkaline phosphatase D